MLLLQVRVSTQEELIYNPLRRIKIDHLVGLFLLQQRDRDKGNGS